MGEETQWVNYSQGIISLWIGSGWLVKITTSHSASVTFVPFDPDCKLVK